MRNGTPCIVIGGNIVVKVVRFEGDQVKLGIQAPEEISVHREAIQAQIARPEAARAPARGASVS
jgi:carbon storage regulator CsrA